MRDPQTNSGEIKMESDTQVRGLEALECRRRRGCDGGGDAWDGVGKKSVGRRDWDKESRLPELRNAIDVARRILASISETGHHLLPNRGCSQALESFVN